MRHLWKGLLALWLIGTGLAVSTAAQAATANGPYYAVPSWAQKTPQLMDHVWCVRGGMNADAY
jgi:hypothetical protein